MVGQKFQMEIRIQLLERGQSAEKCGGVRSGIIQTVDEQDADEHGQLRSGCRVQILLDNGKIRAGCSAQTRSIMMLIISDEIVQRTEQFRQAGICGIRFDGGVNAGVMEQEKQLAQRRKLQRGFAAGKGDAAADEHGAAGKNFVIKCFDRYVMGTAREKRTAIHGLTGAVGTGGTV